MNNDRPQSVRIEHICESPFFGGICPVPNPDDFQDAQPWGRVMHLAQARTENSPQCPFFSVLFVLPLSNRSEPKKLGLLTVYKLWVGGILILLARLIHSRRQLQASPRNGRFGPGPPMFLAVGRTSVFPFLVSSPFCGLSEDIECEDVI